MNESFEKSLQNQKTQFSSFFAQELMLDFLDGELDAQRATALKTKVSASKDLQRLAKSMGDGRHYAQSLREVEPSQTLVDRLQNHKAGWLLWLDRLSPRRWPEFARWTFEAALIAVFVAWVMSFIPVDKLKSLVPLGSRDIVLHEVESVGPLAEPEVDESEDAPIPPTVAEVQTALVDQPIAKPPAPVQTPPKPTAASEPKVESVKVKESAKPKGFLYRASLDVADLESATEGVRLLIESLEGQKAGQVELGWQQESGGSYFHFSLPESNYEALQDGLRTFGPVRIYRDSHWRVMPRGQVRIILEVKGTAE